MNPVNLEVVLLAARLRLCMLPAHDFARGNPLAGCSYFVVACREGFRGIRVQEESLCVSSTVDGFCSALSSVPAPGI